MEKYYCKGGVELKGFYKGRYKWLILFGGIMWCLKVGICSILDIAFDSVKVIHFFIGMFLEDRGWCKSDDCNLKISIKLQFGSCKKW